MKQAKRLFSLLLALTLVLTCTPQIPIKAAAATDGYYTYTVTNGEATITDVSASISGDITIPSTLGGYPVTTIGSDAFYYCSKLASVTIPNSVTTIGDYAFQDCIKLKNIFFDGKAPNIVGRAFSNVTATAYYYPDETWTKDVMRDYSGNITWVALEKACEIIAFGICGAHATWALDEEGTLTISGRGPMYNCETANDVPWAAHRLDIKKVTIGSSVTTIGDNAFESCPSLTSVTIGDSVTTIGSYVFYECTKLTSVTIGNSVTTIGDFTFSGCTGLTSITIPNSVTTIREYAFYECSKLTSVTIGNSVTTIGECAFDTCRSLTSVTIPNSVTTIGSYAFWNCDVLTKIYFDGSAPAIGNNALCNVTATAYYYPDETWTEDMMQKYGSKITWVALEKGLKIVASGKCGANVTWALDEEGTLTISGSGPMYNCETANDVPWADHRNDIKKVIIGDSVTTIGSFMFSYCSRLTSIDIPDSVTTIGFNAFHECTELFSLVIPASVTLIDYYAFYNCICLEEIYFEGSAPRICVDVFYNTEPTSVTAYYYPDASWTEEVMQDYGGDITWVALECPHDYSSVVTPPTCTADGYTTHTCSRCGNTYTDTRTSAKEHTYGPWKPVDVGHHSRTCTVCKTATETKSHDWDEGKVTTAPTCKDTGVMTYTCTTCGGTKAETISVTDDHVYGDWEKVDENYHKHTCTVCKTHSETSKHTFGNDKICNGCGYKAYTVGDFTGDDKVTDADVIYLLWHTVFPEDYPINQGGDFTGDGKVTDADVIYLLWHTVFPEDYPIN